MSESSRVPRFRTTRLLRLGRMAGGVAGGMLAEGVRRWSNGERPQASELILTPGNAQRMANQLAHMRGAAMKMGQLLSMEAGEILPPEFVEVFGRLRQDAHYMPNWQLIRCLNAAWGEGWRGRFAHFPFTPMAAASIGQVHKARLLDGREIAVKVQYPGVRDSIDSDVDNVARLVKMFGIFPDDMDLSPMITEAKAQLHAEADYRREAEWIRAYTDRVGGTEAFQLPEVIDEFTTEEVLTMSFVPGGPIEDVANAPEATRNRVARALIDLTLQEVLRWGLVQTDPNFANYRYHPESGRIGLLDFGATRQIDDSLRQRLVDVFRAVESQNGAAIVDTSVAAGYFAPDEAQRYRSEFVDLAHIAAEPMGPNQPYDFASSRLTGRMRDRLQTMDFNRRFLKLPAPELMFVQRKLTGLYMLCCRLKATVDVLALVAPYLDDGAPAKRA